MCECKVSKFEIYKGFARANADGDGVFRSFSSGLVALIFVPVDVPRIFTYLLKYFLFQPHINCDVI